MTELPMRAWTHSQVKVCNRFCSGSQAEPWGDQPYLQK